MSVDTEIVRGSELVAKVIARINVVRYSEDFHDFKKALAAYNRRRAGRPEVTWTTQSTYLGISLGEEQKKGFVTKTWREDVEVIGDGNGGKVMVVVRPRKSMKIAYRYMPYERSLGFTTHAQGHGLLVDAEFNREINPRRVEEYGNAMEKGDWHDLLSDPITITEDGQVINGQHRLAAASQVDWEKAGSDPQFLIVWGVSPKEALHADVAKRTSRDQATIATKVAVAA